MDTRASEPSASVARRVIAARQHAIERAGMPNSALVGELLERHAPLTAAAASLLRTQLERGALSGRGYHRIRRVARTIADLRDQPDAIDECHVATALALRVRLTPQREA
jgi:magnesium chelatase family protein